MLYSHQPGTRPTSRSAFNIENKRKNSTKRYFHLKFFRGGTVRRSWKRKWSVKNETLKILEKKCWIYFCNMITKLMGNIHPAITSQQYHGQDYLLQPLDHVLRWLFRPPFPLPPLPLPFSYFVLNSTDWNITFRYYSISSPHLHAPRLLSLSPPPQQRQHHSSPTDDLQANITRCEGRGSNSKDCWGRRWWGIWRQHKEKVIEKSTYKSK